MPETAPRSDKENLESRILTGKLPRGGGDSSSCLSLHWFHAQNDRYGVVRLDEHLHHRTLELSVLRHEGMIVRTELVTALHHTASKTAGSEPFNAPRGQNMSNSGAELHNHDDGTTLNKCIMVIISSLVL